MRPHSLMATERTAITTRTSLLSTRSATRMRRWSRSLNMTTVRPLIRTACTNRPRSCGFRSRFSAVLSVIGGWVGIPLAIGGHNEIRALPRSGLQSGWSTSLSTLPHAAPSPSWLSSPFSPQLIGFYIAYVLYYRKPGTAAALAERFKPLYNLLDHKYWVDEIYGRLIVSPLLMLSRIVLGGLVDGLIVQGTGATLAGSTRGLGWLARRMQSGNIRSYAGWLALGAAAVIAIVLFVVHPAHATTVIR